MTPLTDVENELLLRALNCEIAAREELTRTETMWSERAIGGITAGVVVFFSAKWSQVLPLPAAALLVVFAAAMPYFYFEFRRLRRQVSALTHLVLHAKRSDA